MASLAVCESAIFLCMCHVNSSKLANTGAMRQAARSAIWHESVSNYSRNQVAPGDEQTRCQGSRRGEARLKPSRDAGTRDLSIQSPGKASPVLDGPSRNKERSIIISKHKRRPDEGRDVPDSIVTARERLSSRPPSPGRGARAAIYPGDP